MKRVIYILLIISLITIAVYFGVYAWFKGDTFLYYWDALVPFGDNTFIRNFYTWENNFFPGAGGIALSWSLYLFSFSLIKDLTKSISFSQEFLYILHILLSIGSFYFLVKTLIVAITKHINTFLLEAVSLFFGFAYALNLYTYYYTYFMFNPQIYIYSVLPLNMLALFKLFPLETLFLGSKKRFFVWLAVFYLSLFFMIPGFTSYIFFAEYLIILGIYLVFFVLIQPSAFRLSRLVTSGLFLFSVVCLNMWWFGPSLLSFKQLYESQSGLGTDIYIELGSEHNNLLNSFRLLGSPMMNNNVFSWNKFYNNNLFTFPLFIFISGCVYFFFSLKQLLFKRTVLFLSGIFLVTVFIVKLGNPPFKWLIDFAFRYVPFFGAFREAFQKAGMFYIFSYYAISALGIYLFFAYLIKRWNRLVYVLASIIFLIVLVVQTGPFYLFSNDNIKKIEFDFAGKQYEFNAKTKIPDSYFLLKNFIEPRCKGQVILVVPRTSMLSSATWEKEGYSYIGQDILPRLINCSFISVQTMQNDPDAFTTAPYMLLQEGKMSEFKAYLRRNGILMVLVRKDYVPYYYTQWFTVDPEKVQEEIKKDSDYSEIFDNEYFTMYKLASNATSNYGFLTTKSVVYTNTSMRETRAFFNASLFLGENNPLIVNTLDLATQFKDKINGYISVGNCVGCITMDLKSVLTENNSSIISQIKSQAKIFIKAVLKQKSVLNSESDQISIDIISLNNIFLSILKELNNSDINNLRPLIAAYLNKLEGIFFKIENMQAGFFDKNYKYIELNNFVKIEHTTLVDRLNKMQSNTKTKSMQLRELPLELLFYQREALDLLAKKMWITDYAQNKINMRLDIPTAGEYTCKTYSLKKGVKVINIFGDFFPNNVTHLTDNFNQYIEEGSYPVTIEYTADDIVSISSLEVSEANGKEIPLGKLPNGDYSLVLEQGVTNGEVYIIVSNKKLSFSDLTSSGITANKDNFIFLTSIVPTNGNSTFRSIFSVFSLDQSEYFIYIIPLNYIGTGTRSFQFQNIRIAHSLRHDDLQFTCSLLSTDASAVQSNVISVTKNTPVKYTIRLSDISTDQFLTFNETYDPNWEAYTTINGHKYVLQHIKNTYANAWYIDTPNISEVTVQYTQPRKVAAIVIVSLILFLLSVILFLKYEKNR